MQYIHAPEAVSAHIRPDIRRHRAQVLTDNDSLVAVGFKGQDGVKLLSRVVQIDPLAGFHPFRNTEEPVEAHDVVNAENTRMAKVMAQIGNNISVALLSDSFRVQRREFPVLPLGENGIRRRAGRGIQNEVAAFAPHIISVRVYSHGQV